MFMILFTYQFQFIFILAYKAKHENDISVLPFKIMPLDLFITCLITVI